MDKQQKKQTKRYITWGCMVLVVLLLALMPALASSNAEADGPQASILTATAGTADISTRIIGGGQLASDSDEAVTIPAAVKLTKYLVSNGDSIKKGDAIARVDKVSVMTALTEVQETLDYLSEELAAISSDKESSTVTAQTGGLVKIVYAQKGDNVRDVMLEHGALAVLSLDGRMAVEIQRNTQLSYGDTVCVYLADGSEAEGRVESNRNGILTVSLEDNDYAVGETVTVKTEDGDRLGSGELYISSPWNATAYHGTVTEVRAKENTEISAGRTLFRLEASGHTSQFQILSAQRQEYEALMQELFVMYDTGVITAPCDGFVTGVDKDGAFLLASGEEAEQSWFLQPLSHVTENTAPAYTIQLLTNTESDNGGEAAGDGTNSGGEIPGGEASGDEVPGEGNPEENPPAEDPAATAYTVTVGQVVDANGTVALHPTVYTVTDLNSVSTTVGIGGGTDVWPLTGLYNKDLTTPYAGTATVGNILFRVASPDGTVTYVFAAIAAPSQQPQQGQMDAMGGAVGAMGGFGGSYAQEVFEPYSLDTLTIATVTSQEEMTLEITVDEQDISRLYCGQSATVTVEALTGQIFPAEVTSVSNTGTNGGGSSKFTVTLTLQKAGDMLPGMNASAYVDLDSVAQCITIPTAALTEEGSHTLVYTGYDEKNDVLINPVEVTTGLSDGEMVQILSGLSVGDTVYYAYYDTPEISNLAESGFGF